VVEHYKVSKTAINLKDDTSIIASDENWIYDKENMLKYKIIDNLEDYETAKNIYDSIPSINFDEEYLLLIQIQSATITELNIVESKADDTTTYITLGNTKLENSDDNTSNNRMCFTLDNELKRDNINFKIIPGSNEIVEYGFTAMEDITLDYFDKKAYDENCLVLDSFGNVLSDKNILYNFMANSENGALRVIKEIDDEDIEGYSLKVMDIVYENGEYYYFHAMYNEKGNSYPISISGGKKINLEKISNNEYYLYIEKEDGTNTRISIIKLD
jgi:hypothetical protein